MKNKVDFLQLLNDYNIDYLDEGKNVGLGWVNINCPFCDDPSEHFGFNIEEGYVNCWRCGYHSVKQVIQTILDIDEQETINVIRKYQTKSEISIKKSKKDIKRPKEIKWPTGTTSLQKQHIKYLESRNFDYIKLQEEWDLKGTGAIGNFKFRIIAPIFYNSEVVSYQGRDITDRNELRYKPCPKKDELIPYKNLLYGIDKVKTNKIIITEGITDVWRLGARAVATFGLEYTKNQISLLRMKEIKTAFILFDTGYEEQKRARRLARIINRTSSIKTYIIKLDEGDPGSLSPSDALELRNHLLGF